MRRVFIDTSAFVALRNPSEREHEAARQAFRRLVADRVSLFTSNYVFSETYTTLLVRVGRDEAISWGQNIKSGSAVELAHIDDELEDHAWGILEDHSDKRWSYVDATSFALMQSEDVGEAFAFDQHFKQRGLVVIP